MTNLGHGRKISSNEKCKGLVSLERDPFSSDEKKKKEDRKKEKEGRDRGIETNRGGRGARGGKIKGERKKARSGYTGD